MVLFSRELLRKAFHVAGCYIPVAYYFVSRETALIGLSIINVPLLFVELLRLRGKIKLPEKLLRPHEEKQVAAYIYFHIAAFVSILIFEKSIAIAALFMLAIGDTASGIAGAVMKTGNVRNNAKITIKPFRIMMFMFAVCALIGLVLSYLPAAGDMRYLPFNVYLVGALGATIGDAVPIKIRGRIIDDNLAIPLIAGAFMTVAVFI